MTVNIPKIATGNEDSVTDEAKHDDEAKYDDAVYDSKMRGSMTAVKTDWTASYTHPTPELYVLTAGPLNYGSYQNSFNKIIGEVLEKFCSEDRAYSAVEFGALYGNSTLAYKFGLDWDGCCRVWTSDSEPLVPKRDLKVLACDISEPALDWGSRRGIYDDVLAFDFNAAQVPSKVSDSLCTGDMLVILMCTNYLKTENFRRFLPTFLADRSKPKLLCYNVVCAFDTRDLSPLAIIPPGIEGYSFRTDFIKHRDFSPEESAARSHSKESWTIMYTITFDAMKDDNDSH